MLSNATNQPQNLATCALGDSLVHQQWHSPSSWNMKRDFYLDVYTISILKWYFEWHGHSAHTKQSYTTRGTKGHTDAAQSDHSHYG